MRLLYCGALLKGECLMAKETQKTKKTYKYLTKVVQFPDGSRKYFRGKTQEELDEKVLKAQILMKSGVDICSEETIAVTSSMLLRRTD